MANDDLFKQTLDNIEMVDTIEDMTSTLSDEKFTLIQLKNFLKSQGLRSSYFRLLNDLDLSDKEAKSPSEWLALIKE